MFPEEEACLSYLYEVRWPDGFVCPKCGTTERPYRMQARLRVLECSQCGEQTSITAGTVMQDSHTPICTWFWGAYLLTTHIPGMSAVQFQRQLGLGRYETAFQMLHKLRAAMVRPERDRIGGRWPVEIDETLVGGRTRGEGRGVHHKTLVVGAVEIRRGKKFRGTPHSLAVPKRGQTYAGRLRLRVIPDRDRKTLEAFVTANVETGTRVTTDGWEGYKNLRKLGYDHEFLPTLGDPAAIEAALPMIHIVFSNLKTWLLGTHHGVSQKHLQAYLNEYVFRFNRRFYPMVSFNSVLGIGTIVEGPTYEGLYSGEWEHLQPGGVVTNAVGNAIGCEPEEHG
jgi:hypothetical protein